MFATSGIISLAAGFMGFIVANLGLGLAGIILSLLFSLMAVGAKGVEGK